jgi:hypothetical protein
VTSLAASLPFTDRIVPREPSDSMIDQGLAYLPGVDRETLRSAWRIMVDTAERD